MSTQLTPPVGKDDHIKGTADATIEIVEYGDFQCPDCGDAHPVVEHILQVFGKQIRFVFRNLPLTEIHEYALIAAMAAEAAGLQGKYWEMNDLLYENQQDLNEDLLYNLADQLGLNAKKFEDDLQSKALQQKINNDISSAEESGVPGTPTFFVNGKMFDGGADDLLAVLQESVE
jgi:protein-disulfide isomerase